jgi:hypothetical protein
MAADIILAQVLAGISALKTKAELDVVRDAVNAHREKLKAEQPVLEEEMDPLAKGNSDEMIRVNKEKFDYSGVPKKDLLMAERWYMARQPSWKTRHAYNQWRVWNVAKTNEGKDLKGYKGYLIIEKATGKSVSPPPWEGGEEDIEVGEEEVTVAMAAVRVE